jgi:hypothetical protein
MVVPLYEHLRGANRKSSGLERTGPPPGASASSAGTMAGATTMRTPTMRALKESHRVNTLDIIQVAEYVLLVQ